MDEAKELITIGHITTTQGHRGEVRVYPLTDFPERFKLLKQVFWHKEGQIRPLTVEKVRYHKKFVILGFQEIENMNQAQELKGGDIQIPPEELMPLPEGHYYLFQIIGLQVFTVEGEYLGTIKDIRPTGSNDVYYLEDPKTGKEVLIPAIKEVVQEINCEAGKVIIKPLPGLID